MAQRHGLELLYAAEGAIVEWVVFRWDHQYTWCLSTIWSSYSIVFVHGLFGHPVNTWTSEQSKARTPLFWPQKLLPSVVPQSRIYTWGYDVDINHLFSNASQATVFQHAGSLLSDLADERISDEHVSYFILLGQLTIYFYWNLPHWLRKIDLSYLLLIVWGVSW